MDALVSVTLELKVGARDTVTLELKVEVLVMMSVKIKMGSLFW